MSNQYTDFFGYNHICQKKISEGGQGAVYRTETPNMVIKLAQDNHVPINNESRNPEYHAIRLLPIPQGLHITLPIATLEGVSGYVMTLLDDMASFEEVFLEAESPGEFTTPWLDGMRDVPELAEQLRRYIASGGRRRRLDAFYRCACILAQIHGAGLVYCDISMKNLFVSEKTDYTEVWLIDADNLNWAKERASLPGFHTPGYGAPEVLAGHGNSYYSDCYSFAIALFWAIYETHPFEGVGVYDEDGDFHEELRDSGNLPWIFDEEDNSNASDACGLPYEYFISTSMDALLQQTFSAEGRLHPVNRPSMAEWVWVLGQEYDQTVRCPHCGMDYNAFELDACPWCDMRPAIIKITSFHSKEKKTPFWMIIHELNIDQTLEIPVRLVCGARTEAFDDVLFSVDKPSFRGDGLKLSGFHDGWHVSNAETGQELYAEVIVPDKCSLKCERDGEEVWIEVACYESKRSEII